MQNGYRNNLNFQTTPGNTATRCTWSNNNCTLPIDTYRQHFKSPWPLEAGLVRHVNLCFFIFFPFLSVFKMLFGFDFKSRIKVCTAVKLHEQKQVRRMEHEV